MRRTSAMPSQNTSTRHAARPKRDEVRQPSIPASIEPPNAGTTDDHRPHGASHHARPTNPASPSRDKPSPTPIHSPKASRRLAVSAGRLRRPITDQDWLAD